MLPTPPVTTPMLFDTFATNGGYPRNSRTGNVTRVPEPTTALMVPAQSPATRIKIAWRTDTRGRLTG